MGWMQTVLHVTVVMFLSLVSLLLWVNICICGIWHGMADGTSVRLSMTSHSRTCQPVCLCVYVCASASSGAPAVSYHTCTVMVHNVYNMLNVRQTRSCSLARRQGHRTVYFVKDFVYRIAESIIEIHQALRSILETIHFQGVFTKILLVRLTPGVQIPLKNHSRKGVQD